MNHYESIPIGKENAISKNDLMILWKMKERGVREMVEKLRSQDNGDDMVIISTSKQSGYYRTDNRQEIRQFKAETSKRAKHTFRPLRKVNRILGADEEQVSFTNNLKIARMQCGLKGDDVIVQLRKLDSRFDKSLLSKIENGLCMPTPEQLSIMSKLYGKTIIDMIGISFINV
ncbi:MAG: hypothetical protein WHF31_15365 [Candidatus Dehalobacter alkaniphilus]